MDRKALGVRKGGGKEVLLKHEKWPRVNESYLEIGKGKRE